MGRKPFNNDVVDGSGQDKSTSAMAELRKLRFDPVTRDLCPGATTCGRARAATCPILSKTTAKAPEDSRKEHEVRAFDRMETQAGSAGAS